MTATFGWSPLLLLAVFVPLATMRYQAGSRGRPR
jgi:hypothetical protein